MYWILRLGEWHDVIGIVHVDEAMVKRLAKTAERENRKDAALSMVVHVDTLRYFPPDSKMYGREANEAWEDVGWDLLDLLSEADADDMPLAVNDDLYWRKIASCKPLSSSFAVRLFVWPDGSIAAYVTNPVGDDLETVSYRLEDFKVLADWGQAGLELER